MDNIGIFDRNANLPGGVRLEQSDATAWMAFFCNEMLAITLELARVDPDYEEMASTFAQHFVSISEALNGPGGLWDEEAGFYHDQLRSGDRRLQLKVRSLVGLMPLIGAVSIQGSGALEGVRRRLLELADRYPWFRRQVQGPVERPGPDGRPLPTVLVSLVPRDRLERLSGRCSTSGSSCRRTGSGRCPASTSSVPPRWIWRGSASRCATFRASRTAGCSAGTPTGADRSGCRSTRCSSRPSTTITGSTATTSRWSSRPDPVGA